MRLPSKAELEAARDKTIPDVLAPGMRVLFIGINPGLVSGATGHHFARPGNRFWAALHGAGFTPRLLSPEEDVRLPEFGLGITNLVPRTTARADELDDAELRHGAERLRDIARVWHPGFLAIVGVSSFRAAFSRPDAVVGRQPESIAESTVWVLPNPSGLNAHYQLPALVRVFRELHDAAFDAPEAGG